MDICEFSGNFRKYNLKVSMTVQVWVDIFNAKAGLFPWMQWQKQQTPQQKQDKEAGLKMKMPQSPLRIAVTAGTLLLKVIILRRVQMKARRLAGPKYLGREDRGYLYKWAGNVAHLDDSRMVHGPSS